MAALYKSSYPMKKFYLIFLYVVACLSESGISQTVTYYNQTFKIDTLYPKAGGKGMNSPWELIYGPDDSLWVTEAHNYKIWKIHPGNKGSRLVLNLSGNKNFTDTVGLWPQGGLMGLAIHPQFTSGKPWVYIAYVYLATYCPQTVCYCTSSLPCRYNTQIVRYSWNFATGTLTPVDTLITGLNGSNDHNSGRIKISPIPESDGRYHLYYTIGDMGAGNNNNNIYRKNNAQDTTVLEGKVLRLNTEPDGGQTGGAEWVPDDNPFPAGAPATAKNAIYSYGHRNPQGLIFGSVNGGASYILYSSEHGDRSDDEVNIILPHSNYGWPKVSGLCDDNYTSALHDSMYLANKSVISEKGFCDTSAVQQPFFSFYNWSRAANKTAGALGNMSWPTIAPSSINFYGAGPIPGWKYSLLIPSLKNGLFRLKLKADGLTVDSTAGPSDTLHYLPGYRLRNIAIAPAGDTLFLAVDSSCCTLGPGGTMGSSVASPARGFILRMVYLTTLALNDRVKKMTPPAEDAYCKVYPNPVAKTLYIHGKQGAHKPLLAQLYDITGKPVLEMQTQEDNFTLDIHYLTEGIYILRLSNGYGVTLLLDKILKR
jgi:PQQ-dependent dehydrogenase (s-GDH family)